MKIMTFTHESELNGASKSLLSLIDHLSDQHEFWIVTAFGEGPFYDEVKSRGFHILVFSYENWMQRHIKNTHGELGWIKRKIRWNIRGNHINRHAAEQISKVIIQQGIDLLYTNTRVVDVGLRCSEITGIPHILHVREFGEEDFDLYPMMAYDKHIAYIKAHSDCVIYNSRAVMNKFERFHFRNQQVVYNGVDRSIHETNHNSDVIRFLISGRVSRAKGQVDALRAARILMERKYRNFEVWVAGTIDETYTEFCKESQEVSENIRILGYRTDIEDLRQRSDVELVCSVQEAFGRVTVEAMMVGNPVIGSNTGGTPELIEDGINGFLYSPGDAEVLADRMQYFLDNTSQIVSMGVAARRYAETNFTVEQYIDHMKSIFDSFDHSIRSS